MSNYIKAKSKLFTSTQTAILNQADSNYSALKKLIPSGVKIITYPQNLNSSVTQAIKTRFTQDYNQINCQAALIAVYMVLESQPDLTDAIVSFPGIPGRMEEVKNDLKIKTIVDFAHTPNSLEKVLQSLKSQTKHKLIAVFGAAGLRDHQKRPLMGKIASKLADEVILTAEDPRTEPVWSIIHQIVQGVVANHSHIHKIPDRQQAINFALKLAKPGDTVVVLGKGHEKSMCFGKIEHSWSDQEALNKAIRLKHAKN